VSILIENREYKKRMKPLKKIQSEVLHAEKQLESADPSTLTEEDLETKKEEMEALKKKAKEMEIELGKLKERIEVNQLGAGKSFGEKALISHQPRNATVKCLEPSHFAVMSKEDYERMLLRIEVKKQNEMNVFLR